MQAGMWGDALRNWAILKGLKDIAVASSRDGRGRRDYAPRDRAQLDEQEFRCRHCQRFVTYDPAFAGVQNRNHCPHCLWSLHVDDRSAGDRRAECRSLMRPVGLTTKRSRNKYARERDGELMLIHQCTGCGKVVINRIAADDNDAAILAVFAESHTATPTFRDELAAMGVEMLGASDEGLVRKRLAGAA